MGWPGDSTKWTAGTPRRLCPRVSHRREPEILLHPPTAPPRRTPLHSSTGSPTHLLDSTSGPTGDFESSSGEDDSITSSSRLRLSFLSNPASLPVHGGGGGGKDTLDRNGAGVARGRSRRLAVGRLRRPAPHSAGHDKPRQPAKRSAAATGCKPQQAHRSRLPVCPAR